MEKDVRRKGNLGDCLFMSDEESRRSGELGFGSFSCGCATRLLCDETFIATIKVRYKFWRLALQVLHVWSYFHNKEKLYFFVNFNFNNVNYV